MESSISYFRLESLERRRESREARSLCALRQLSRCRSELELWTPFTGQISVRTFSLYELRLFSMSVRASAIRLNSSASIFGVSGPSQLSLFSGFQRITIHRGESPHSSSGYLLSHNLTTNGASWGEFGRPVRVPSSGWNREWGFPPTLFPTERGPTTQGPTFHHLGPPAVKTVRVRIPPEREIETPRVKGYLRNPLMRSSGEDRKPRKRGLGFFRKVETSRDYREHPYWYGVGSTKVCL